jgi:hypothetical protein
MVKRTDFDPGIVFLEQRHSVQTIEVRHGDVRNNNVGL